MSQTFNFTFSNLSSYEKYKKDVVAQGGTIKHDLGTTILGFSAVIPPTLVETIRSCNLTDSGITSFDPDGVATIQ